jgi:hypothetical protein
MSRYTNRLDDLLTLVKGGAITPSSGVEQLWGLQDERRARRQEQQASLGAPLDILAETALSAVGEPTSLDQVLALAQAKQGFAGGNVPGALDALFDSTGAPRFGGATLTVDDRQQLAAEVAEGIANGWPLEEMKRKLASVYGNSPDVMSIVEELAPALPQVGAQIPRY